MAATEITADNAPATPTPTLILTNTGGDTSWFTQAIPGAGPFAATVHTDATDNLFVPLSAPNRILDTRSSAGRASVLDASGNLNSSGMLIGGKTIHVNLTRLVAPGLARPGAPGAAARSWPGLARRRPGTG